MELSFLEMKTCLIILICLPVFLFGCTFSFVYTDISGDQRQLDNFLDDRGKCLQEASVENETGLVCNGTIMDACLTARGWSRGNAITIGTVEISNSIIIPIEDDARCNN